MKYGKSNLDPRKKKSFVMRLSDICRTLCWDKFPVQSKHILVMLSKQNKKGMRECQLLFQTPFILNQRKC